MFFLLKRLFSLFLPTFFAFLTNDFSLFLYVNISFILISQHSFSTLFIFLSTFFMRGAIIRNALNPAFLAVKRKERIVHENHCGQTDEPT